MRMTWSDALTALRGVPLLSSSIPDEVTGMSTDNRQTKPGHIFFCIRGARFDGRDFAADAVKRGAVAIVADLPFMLDGPRAPVVLVDNVTRALGRLARVWRDRATAKVVGVTGTAGKTTVKEVLAQVLSREGVTARNEMNLNNHLGLPRSILSTNGDERFWVMEAGISREGDMDELGVILAPDLAIILNAGPGHTEGLGENVARHKAALLQWLRPSGLGLVSADYPDLVREARAFIRKGTCLELFTSRREGVNPEVPYSASYLGPVADSGQDACPVFGRYRVRLGYWEGEMAAPFRGSYGAENVIAVCAAAYSLGLTPESIAAGLAEAKLPQQRFTCSRSGDWLIVDDSYNANPLSAKRMIESAAELASSPPRGIPGVLVCVMGEMLELGACAEIEHRALGSWLAMSGARLVAWKGGHGEAVKRGLEQADFSGTFVMFDDPGALPDILRQYGLLGGVMLFKGSRGNRLEECVARLEAGRETGNAV